MVRRFTNSISAGVLLSTVSALALLGSQAKADLTFVNPNFTGGTFVYDLNFSTSTDIVTGQPVQRLDTTSFATLYDIGGFTSATLNPAFAGQFTLSQQATGLTPASVSPTDTALPNLTLHYIGANLTTDTSFAQILTVNSTFNSVNTNGQYTAMTTKNTGSDAGTAIGSVGRVSVPGLTASTPEPGSIALFVGMGLSGSVFAFRRRRNRK